MHVLKRKGKGIQWGCLSLAHITKGVKGKEVWQSDHQISHCFTGECCSLRPLLPSSLPLPSIANRASLVKWKHLHRKSQVMNGVLRA